MRTLSNKQGFSLIELLTVIAIIAILAAIIFPVMSSVKDKAKATNCMTNLMQIQNAIKMYKMDNRTYPTTLGPVFQAGIPFDKVRPMTGEMTCFMDQIKAPKAYRCPASEPTDYSKSVEMTYPVTQPGGKDSIYLYAVDSYDTQTNMGGASVSARYLLKWATDVTQVESLSPYPPSTTDTPELKESDFARQLCFKNPPEDTVITWCTYHKGDMALVLFLDGHVDKIPKLEIWNPSTSEGCLWRVRPKNL